METEPKAGMARQRARLLIIDDDPALARAMARMLSDEHDVTALTSAQEGLDRIAGGERFDLILCDLIMPQVTGMDFAERLPPIAPELIERLIFITGGAYTERAAAFVAQAAIAPLEKPLRLDELRLAVREGLLRRGDR